MDDFYKIDYSLIKKYLKKKNILNKVSLDANLFRYKDNVYKIFDLYLKYLEKYEFFCSIKNPSFVFPNEIIMMNDNFKGYIMDFAKGTMFSNLSSDILLEKFLVDFDNVDENIKIISNNNILIRDLNKRNILYNELDNTIKIIDVDEYKILLDLKDEDIYFKNLHEFRYVLKLLLLENFYFNKDLDNIIFNYKKSTLEVFKESIQYLENKYDGAIYSINDIKKLKK